MCVSGTMMLGDRTEVIDFIRINGGVWSASVTSSVDVLVIHPNELSPPTTKVRSALAHGIPIVNEKFLTDSVANGSPVLFAPYAVRGGGRVRGFASVVYGLASGIVSDIFHVLCVVCAFVGAVPFRIVPTFLAFRWTEAGVRGRIFYYNLAKAAFLEWLGVAVLALAINWLVSRGLHEYSLSICGLLLLGVIGGVALLNESREHWITWAEFRNFIWDKWVLCIQNHIPIIPPLILTFLLCIVVGPIAICVFIYRSKLGQSLALFFRNHAPKILLVLLFVTAIPLRLIPVTIVVLRMMKDQTWSNERIRAKVLEDQLSCNVLDFMAEGACFALYWLYGTAGLFRLYASVPNVVSSVAAIWLLVGAVYCAFTWSRRSTKQFDVLLQGPVTFWILVGLGLFSVGWIIHLLSSLVDRIGPVIQRTLAEVVTIFERIFNVLHHSIVRPIFFALVRPIFVALKALFSPLGMVLRWVGRIFPAEFLGRMISSFMSAVALGLVLLFIIVTIYRIPTLIRAFRNRSAGETTSDTIWRAVEAERAWIQSSSQQRANRWRAVAQRKRLKKAQANAKQEEVEEGEEEAEQEVEIVPSPPRRRASSRSPARRSASRSKSPKSKSPARRRK